MTSSCKKKAKPVEKLLKDTMMKLTEANAVTRMFRLMIRSKVATNDVRNFLQNQMKMRRISKGIDYKLLKNSMRSKLNDSCAYVKRLKQERSRLKTQLFKMYKNRKAKALRVLKWITKQTRSYRRKCEKKNSDKYNKCKEKIKSLELEMTVPKDTLDFLKDVNAFKGGTMEPEALVGPMVCHADIILSREEQAFLSRGPNFMMRQKLDEDEFKVDVEKMITKREYTVQMEYNEQEE